MAASGILTPEELRREHFNRRIGPMRVLKYSEIYPEVAPGQYLKPQQSKASKKTTSPRRFNPRRRFLEDAVRA